MKRGDIDFLCSRDLSAVVWCDRAPLYFLSTFDNPHQTTTVKRKDKDGAVVQVQCPLVVSSYTQYMGGCDLNDQLTKLYRCRRHYRWPRRLIMKCILWTCYNAYVLLGHFQPHAQPGKRLYTFYDFVDSIVLSLIGDYRSPLATRRRSIASQSLDRLNNVGVHMPERPAEASGNHRCVVCREKRLKYAKAHPGLASKSIPYKDCKTVFRCTSCKEYLCIRQGSTCWTDYHSKVEFWRWQALWCFMMFYYVWLLKKAICNEGWQLCILYMGLGAVADLWFCKSPHLPSPVTTCWEGTEIWQILLLYSFLT